MALAVQPLALFGWCDAADCTGLAVKPLIAALYHNELEFCRRRHTMFVMSVQVLAVSAALEVMNTSGS
jgi:hypothetical protein